MPGSPKRRQRRARTEDLRTDPATMVTIVQRIAAGGTLVELSREWDVPYNELATWIAAEPDRQERYKIALDLRGEYLHELVIAGIRTIADVDPAEAFDAKGKLLPVHKMPPHVRRAIHTIDRDKVRFVSREKGLELLGRYRKMFTDKVEHSGKVTLEDLVSGSMNTPPIADSKAIPQASRVDE